MGIPLFTSATSHLKFAHGASRHQNTRELPLEQKLNLHQVGDSIKRHTDLFKYGYISYVCHRHSVFKHTTWSTMLSLSDHDATLTQFDWHALLRAKSWRVYFRHRGWGRQRYLPPRLRGDMATTTIVLDSSFNLLLISRILVDNNGNCRHHVRPRDLPARWDNTLGSLCQQHTPIHDYSLKLMHTVPKTQGGASLISSEQNTLHT